MSESSSPAGTNAIVATREPIVKAKDVKGQRVHFVDPITGFVLEAVHGQAAEALPARRDRIVYNHGGVYERRFGRSEPASVGQALRRAHHLTTG